MKRRLLSQVLPRQDVCLLCATRLTNASTLRRGEPRLSYRAFGIYAGLSQSPAAQAKLENGSDPEFTMLKQNARLSFPGRKSPQAATPPSSPSPPTEQPQKPQRSVPRRAPGIKSQNHAVKSVPMTSTSAGVSGHSTLPIRRIAFNRDQNWTPDASEDRIQQSDSQRRSSRPRPSKVRPTDTFNRENVPHQFQARQVRDRRSPEAYSTKWPSQNTAEHNFRIRKSPVKDHAEWNSRGKPPALEQALHPGTRTVVLEKTDDTGVLDEVSKMAPSSVEAPAGSTFGALDGFHHRHHIREDKRSRRSDRFEDGEAESSAPASSQKSNARERGRGGRFDLDALEAEEMLYGEGRRKKKKKSRQAQNIAPSRPTLNLPEFLSVERLAQMLKVNLEAFIDKLLEEGYEGARYDHVLDAGTSALFAELYGFEPVIAGAGASSDLTARPPPEDLSTLPSRPPIVTIMGHVDHGKTTILDFFRKSSVVASEHGGITQHIGAFSVVMPGTNKQITFLDTPGHAAFLEMRRRGANVTDIVVLVVAADDSVKPQTIEAIKHSLEANVQIIVAVNKIDKPEADVERVKQDLTRHDIVVEDYGGDYQVIPVSGKTGQGMADLEEAIITLSDVNDYRAEADGLAEGWVIESKVTQSGRVATVLVRRGTLRVGDSIVAGTTWARVRTLRNDAGALVDSAPPGTPVQVDGWRGDDPTAGLEVLQATDEDHAKEVVDFRLEQEENLKTAANMTVINNARTEEAEARAKVVAWERQQDWSKKSYGLRPKDNEGWVEADEAAGPKKIHFVVKADVAGSVEALVAAVSAIGNNDVVANIIHSSTGQLTESDIRILATTGEKGYAISFNQVIDGNVARLAEAADLAVLDHNIIYKVTDHVKEILADHLPPLVTQRVLGEAEIGQIFEVTIKRQKVKIAGCRVTNGTISRSHKVRVLRGSEVVFTGSLDSLKNVKKDVTEMRKGTECGMGFEEWADFQEGDQVQCFEEHHEKRTLY